MNQRYEYEDEAQEDHRATRSRRTAHPGYIDEALSRGNSGRMREQSGGARERPVARPSETRKHTASHRNAVPLKRIEEAYDEDEQVYDIYEMPAIQLRPESLNSRRVGTRPGNRVDTPPSREQFVRRDEEWEESQSRRDSGRMHAVMPAPKETRRVRQDDYERDVSVTEQPSQVPLFWFFAAATFPALGVFLYYGSQIAYFVK
jgi:hypothetical protein